MTWTDLREQTGNGCSENSFGPVALDCFTDCLAGGDANSDDLLLVFLDKQYNKRVGIGTAMLPHPLEISRLLETKSFFHQKFGKSKKASVPNHYLCGYLLFQSVFLVCLFMRTERRWRPFNRRRLSTLRPPRVDMRSRNPCTRTRRRFLGW